jgi:DNA-directed RNA polymerase subunit RPC12/RpoP
MSGREDVISFNCSQCSTTYEVTDDKAGKRTTCAKCRQSLVVPRPLRAEVEASTELVAPDKTGANIESESISLACPTTVWDLAVPPSPHRKKPEEYPSTTPRIRSRITLSLSFKEERKEVSSAISFSITSISPKCSCGNGWIRALERG